MKGPICTIWVRLNRIGLFKLHTVTRYGVSLEITRSTESLFGEENVTVRHHVL